MKNQVQLIAYAQRLGEGNLRSLDLLLKNELKNLFATVHILPFFTPIDGADMGFDPTEHREVDAQLGTWDDIKNISAHTDVMADCIVNHISADSAMFRDYQEKGTSSRYADLFLSMKSIFPQGAKEEELAQIYRPRPGLSFTLYTIGGEKKLIWTTFTNKQIDIDVYSDSGKQYLNDILETFSRAGIRAIRLDAVGYAVKKAGTTCFMTEDTFSFVEEFSQQANLLGLETLVEIHSYYKLQIEIAKRVDWVYDFALPPLILHTLHARDCNPLATWLSMSPRNCLTVLDTHDGIGIIDVGPQGDKEGLLNAEETDSLVEAMHDANNGESRLATGAVASNLDLYQVNCTFYDALGKNDEWYLWARAIQFFSPGIPQVYYVGLFAGSNEMELLSSSQVGRDINRGVYDTKRTQESLKRPVVQSLLSLIRFRNTHPAFQGDFRLESYSKNHCALVWEQDIHVASFVLNTQEQNIKLEWTSEEGKQSISSIGDLKNYF